MTPSSCVCACVSFCLSIMNTCLLVMHAYLCVCHVCLPVCHGVQACSMSEDEDMEDVEEEEDEEEEEEEELESSDTEDEGGFCDRAGCVCVWYVSGWRGEEAGVGGGERGLGGLPAS